MLKKLGAHLRQDGLEVFLILTVCTGDQVLSATVYFDNMTYEDAMQILEHAQAYKLKLCLKRKPEITETDLASESVIPVNIFKGATVGVV